MTDTISYLEAVWLTVLCVGIIASFWMTYQSYADLRARRRSGRNGLMLRRARNDLRTEIIRLSVLLSLTWFGYRAFQTPVLPIEHWWHYNVLIPIAVLIWIPLALGYDAIRSSMTRKYIIDEFDNRYNHQ